MLTWHLLLVANSSLFFIILLFLLLIVIVICPHASVIQVAIPRFFTFTTMFTKSHYSSTSLIVAVIATGTINGLRRIACPTIWTNPIFTKDEKKFLDHVLYSKGKSHPLQVKQSSGSTKRYLVERASPMD